MNEYFKAERSDFSDGAVLRYASFDEVWREIVRRAGEIFYTAKGLPFTYTVKGGELFCSRRKGRSITRSTFGRAYETILGDRTIVGPKRLQLFGAPYVWAILKEIGAVTPRLGQCDVFLSETTEPD